MVRILLVILLGTSFNCFAAIDAYPFPDEQLQQRYDGLIAELRCPQCLNTNLAGSDAMIAQDLRREVHRMLLDGHTDDEILTFMYERYGDFILYRPRLGAGTLVLWLGPLLLLMFAGLVWFRLARAKPEVHEINTEEQARLDELLRDSDP
ncbi:MAG: cytochrome c-type biogenesis protein CcmH [Gammaproteobacteria bacterium]|jgi:cytochrome c-type biogenesis protein CcmH|nr:cytochrome c-type biogenesis protein CcmH [Gammaproteobacteria bacterium]MBT3868556.1 cytochrome c-type biogenesis protein CcmH [Gammaproteobacteria bacterium]MBT4379845.1 cytochrome c-type biogenesis protein CcmH [Gammaproteobacteria bacterium]MBT4619330.1 cytochrome c-type biogenesis protein CcmH [Gammaproteobacteria bacterium]MBT5196544.1 cytochrome c-type biogenesis protein CcmH [Gammaproteobacteria bacterium]